MVCLTQRKYIVAFWGFICYPISKCCWKSHVCIIYNGLYNFLDVAWAMGVVNQFVANIEQLIREWNNFFLWSQRHNLFWFVFWKKYWKCFYGPMCIPKRMLTTSKVVMGIWWAKCILTMTFAHRHGQVCFNCRGGWIYHNQHFNKNWMGSVHFDKGIYHSQGFDENMICISMRTFS